MDRIYRGRAASTAIGLLLMAAPAAAYAQISYDIRLPSQELADSLRAVGSRTHVNVAFDPAVVRGKTAPALRGSYSAEEALQRLTADAGLSVRASGARSFLIEMAPIRAAYVTQAASPPAPRAPSEPPPAAAETVPVEESVVDTVVVTGSRLQNTGFLAPTPVSVVGSAELARQGATNVTEVLNQLPAFRATNTPSTAAIYAANIGSVTADLRALGANRTLVLVDGRRVVPTNVQGAMVPANTVDLNIIPTALIDRAEVVTGGASAAYGSDAVAGVVNIILNTKLEGFRGSLQYGETELGDGETWAASFAYGTRIGDRGHLVVGGDYSDDKGTGDCYTRDWCLPGRNQVNNPDRTNGLPAILLLPQTSFATATRNGVITAGPLRGQEFTPDGLSTRPHDYGTYYGTGLFQSGGGDGIHPYWENVRLSAPVRRYATLAHLDYELTDSIRAFGEVSYARVKGTTIGAQTRDAGNIVIRNDNPFLPASVVSAMAANGITSFNFGRIGDDLGPSVGFVTRSTSRFVAGLDGDLGSSWKWDAYYQYGRTKYHQEQANSRINDNFTRAVDAVRNGAGQIVCRVNADADTTNNDAACAPLNLFGENHFSQEAKAYAYGTAVQDSRLTQHVVAGSLSGDVLDLWAGPLSLAVGGEYREDSVRSTTDPISTALRFYTGAGSPINGSVKVKEGFVEAGLPLARDMAFAHSLDLNGAVRITDYSTSGSVTSWKIGGTWEPVRQLRLRVTKSRDIRAANIFELYAARTSGYQSTNDPARGGATGLVLTYGGGNPDLKPEIAKTFTAGVVFLPDFWGLDRLRISADYYDIKVANQITTLGAQPILDLCARGNQELCAQIVRDASGALASINNVNLNLNQVSNRGIDFEVSYSKPLSDIVPSLGGTLSVRAFATRTFRLTTVDPTGNAINRVGQLGPIISIATGGIPKWQGTVNFTYSTGPFSTTAQVRYVSSGVRDLSLIGPDDPRYSPTLPNSVNMNHVKAYAYLNLSAQYAVVDRDNRKVELFGVINNVFNTDPPNHLPFFSPTNPVLYDVLGRTYRGGVRIAF